MRILIAYATNEGQTRKIADNVAGWITERDHKATLFDVNGRDREPVLRGYDAYIVAGSLHVGKHQKALVEFVKRHHLQLPEKRSAFISVSMSASGTSEKNIEDCWRCIRQFYDETDWVPSMSLPIGGALLYTRYNFLIRALMKWISTREGGPTDTSRDHELTDWSLLRSFVERFLGSLARADLQEKGNASDPRSRARLA